MLVMLVSGVIIHKKIFREFFTFRPKKQVQRASLDSHNLTGVVVLPFHFLVALSQERHWADVASGLTVTAPTSVALRRWRQVASLGLATGWLICWLWHGASFGSLLWILTLTAAAIAVALTLAWRTVWLRPIARLLG